MPDPGVLAVIYGGPSAEHEVSCISAHRIVATALRSGFSVKVIGLTHDKEWVDANGVLSGVGGVEALDSPDDLLHRDPTLRLSHLGEGLPPDSVVFPALHGPFGEDGVLQGHLETLDVPYVGAGVLASSICMDKGIAKSVLRDHGLPVAAWRLVARSSWSTAVMEEAVEALGLPIFVKPANLGSSIGVAKAFDAAALGDAVLSAFEFDDRVILEEFVAGRELELALLGNEDVRVTRAGEIIATREFYDYDDKYVLGLAETVAPTDLKDVQLEQAQQLVLAAYRALRVEGLARIDIFLREDDEIVINEVNTMPGFTPISMFPMLWEAEGLPFGAVVEELVLLARARHARRRLLRTHRVL
ncbi:MAG TPA: D-alanine--D-alanine ligase family protein [Acidimicrobiales bacterium]|jgi:D-alanine-D-alanine ligase|nr:D-alanine--D-alanine ligase family protein [Acidimicrobiales bacterium]